MEIKAEASAVLCNGILEKIEGLKREYLHEVDLQTKQDEAFERMKKALEVETETCEGLRTELSAVNAELAQSKAKLVCKEAELSDLEKKMENVETDLLWLENGIENRDRELKKAKEKTTEQNAELQILNLLVEFDDDENNHSQRFIAKTTPPRRFRSMSSLISPKLSPISEEKSPRMSSEEDCCDDINDVDVNSHRGEECKSVKEVSKGKTNSGRMKKAASMSSLKENFDGNAKPKKKKVRFTKLFDVARI